MVDQVYIEHLQRLEDASNDFKDECILSIIVLTVTAIIFSFYMNFYTAFFLLNAILMVWIFERKFDRKIKKLQEELKNDPRSVICSGENNH